jgi:hydroxymethylbilane synthase
LIIGTRGSRLALRQTEIVRGALIAANPGIALDVREIRTEGDASSAPLSEIGGLGVFTKAIEDALLANRIDIAVHSLKDLPPRDTAGLTIAAVPPRADARDALVTTGGRTLAELLAGARIGTGSARRAAQLRSLRGDIETLDIRGNVDTRIRKVEAGDYDGAVLALAGLQRLGLEAKAAQIFSVSEMVPAVGQACLAVQVRTGDVDAFAAVSAIDHLPSHCAALCERAYLARLGAGCRWPAGAYADVEGDLLRARAMLSVGDDARRIDSHAEGSAADAERIGVALAESIIAEAGAEFAGVSA